MTDVSVEAAPAAARRAEERDVAAFRELYATEYPRVARYAYQLVRNADLAAELAQEAFTRLLPRWRRVREPQRYVYRIVTNLARDAWKDASRDQAHAESLSRNGAAVHPAPDTSVRDAVSRLPRRYRDLVLLYYYADLSLPDVAAAVRRPPGTVKRMLSEARDLLERSLGDGHVD